MRTDNALKTFRSGFNCTQAVLSSFAEDLKLDTGTALSVACGFGAGMGRLQETCGAVTGAYMAIGVFACRNLSDNQERKEQSYAMIRQFDKQFKDLHGSTNCMDLIGCDLSTLEGRTDAKNRLLFDTICEKCVSDAVIILEKMIKQKYSDQ